MVADGLNKVHLAVGLTCDKREVLLLRPLVKDVKSYKPKLDISVA